MAKILKMQKGRSIELLLTEYIKHFLLSDYQSLRSSMPLEELSGYNGSSCATPSCFSAPVIPVQTVPGF
ncbi:hypothetical protein [Cyclobacterium qasimii]|uniref:hypothetical protein n=1 Tax=Cyclobacterium qasimii TaxID=1350429 RepID=UPI0011BF84FC|nr:hypothetical protein [Cyclobacterium qasimii]